MAMMGVDMIDALAMPHNLDVTNLDVTGLRCPLPVLRAGHALRALPPGAELVVRATDPMAVLDLGHFCAEAGHELLSTTEAAGVFTFVIRRGGG